MNFQHGSLIVSGRVSVDDGTNKCRKSVPVKIKRKKNGKFRTVKSTVTNRKGRYSVSIADKEGLYKAKAPKVKKGQANEDICKPTSEVERHEHNAKKKQSAKRISYRPADYTRRSGF